MIIENGKPYPDARYRNHEGLVIVPTQTFFFLLAVVPGLSRAEIMAWKEGRLRYGVFTQQTIPFFLLDFPEVKMTLDAPFNFLKLDPDVRSPWAAETDANLLHMVLVESNGFIVRSQRAIGIQPAVTEELKTTASQQVKVFNNTTEIDRATAIITKKFSTEAMIETAKMYPL